MCGTSYISFEANEKWKRFVIDLLEATDDVSDRSCSTIRCCGGMIETVARCKNILVGFGRAFQTCGKFFVALKHFNATQLTISQMSILRVLLAVGHYASGID